MDILKITAWPVYGTRVGNQITDFQGLVIGWLASNRPFLQSPRISGSLIGTKSRLRLETASDMCVREDTPLRRIRPSLNKPTLARMELLLIPIAASLIFPLKRMNGQDVWEVRWKSNVKQLDLRQFPQLRFAQSPLMYLRKEYGILSLKYSHKKLKILVISRVRTWRSSVIPS